MRRFPMRRTIPGSISLVICLAAACLLSGASVLPKAYAQDAAPAATAPAAIDPLKLMPASTFAYMHIDLDAGQKFLDSIKDTHLGAQIQTLWKGMGNDPNMKGLQMMLPLLQGFGRQIGVGVELPAAADAAAGDAAGGNAAKMPNLLAVVPIANPDQAKMAVDLISRGITQNGKITWKDEAEGANTVHIATGDVPAGQPLPAYSLTPGALIIGTGGPLIHEALQRMDTPGNSLADSTRVQALSAGVDRTQFLWGFVDTSPRFMKMMMEMGQAAGKAAAKAGGAGAAANPPPDMPNPMDIPGLKDIMAASQGTAFSLGLHPDRLELQAVGGYDPDTAYGKIVRSWQSNPIKAQNLASGHAVAFLDMGDMPHFAQQWNLIIPGMVEMMNKAAGKQPGAEAILPIFEGMLQSFGDLVNGSGNEMALVVGALTPQLKSPPVTLLIQKSDNPRLQKGIDSLLDSIQTMMGEKRYTRTLLDTVITTLGPQGSPIRPSYAQIGDFHVLALDPETIKTPLYLVKGDQAARSLANSPSFQKIHDLLGPQAIGNFYIDVHSIAQFIEAMAKGPAGKAAVGANAGKQPGAAMGLELLNDLRQIGSAYYPNPNGMASRLILTYDLNAAPPAAGQ